MKINTRYDILTPEGFKHFDGIQKKNKPFMTIEFDNGISLQTSYNHLIYDFDGTAILAKDIKLGDKIKSKDGFLIVKKIKKHKKSINLYDIVNAGENKIYYTNNVISHNCSFLGSGDNVIEMPLILLQEKENCCEPIRKEYMNDLWIWKDPEEGHRYVAGLDVSRGDAEDSTGFAIIDFDTWEEVLEYKGKMPPDVAATLLTRYAIKYQAFTCIDITGGMGVSTARKLTELNFPTKLLYYDGLSDLELFGGAPEGAIPGINFSAKNNRVLIIQALEEAIRVSGFKIRSLRATNELRKFVYINGKPDHLKGAHDDILMSLGMAIYTANIAFNKLTKSNSQLEAMANSWKKFENTTTPILEQTPQNFNPKTQNYKSPYMPENNYRTGVGKSAYEQFSWLFGVTQKQKEEYFKNK